jgi:hypothetical protein
MQGGFGQNEQKLSNIRAGNGEMNALFWGGRQNDDASWLMQLEVLPAAQLA